MATRGGNAMDRLDSDPSFTPTAVRMAQPLVDQFVDSTLCPHSHRWHARSTLCVLALYVGMTTEPHAEGLAWEELDPDGLLSASLEIDPDEHAFLRDLLDVSASFYGFLAEERWVPRARAYE